MRQIGLESSGRQRDGIPALEWDYLFGEGRLEISGRPSFLDNTFKPHFSSPDFGFAALANARSIF